MNKKQLFIKEYNDTHKFKIITSSHDGDILQVQRISDNMVFGLGEKIISSRGNKHTILEFKIKQRTFSSRIVENVDIANTSGIDEIWVIYCNNEGGNWLCNINTTLNKSIVLTKTKTKKNNKISKIKYPEPGQQYRHYKGGLYEVMFCSKHTETDEIFVNYKSIIFGSYHSRPLELWNQLSENGKTRFKLEK